MKKILVVSAMLLLSSVFANLNAQNTTAIAVPQKYKAIYEALDKKLFENEKLVRQSSVVWGSVGVELTLANSNRGVALLKPETLPYIRKNLNSLVKIGTTGITLNIAFPMLRPTTPRQKEYLAFYKKLVAEIRNRKLSLMIKVHNVFPDPVYGIPEIKIKGMKYEDYLKQKKDQIVLIIKELKPDLLTLENEPGTQKFITGFNFTSQLWKNTIAYYLKDLKHDGIKIGAGAGSWDDIPYFKALCDLPLDFIDVHVYPVTGNYLAKNLEIIANLIKSKNKELVIGEAWLYKASSFQNSSFQKDYINTFVSDSYSFWEPLDARFVKLVFNLSRIHRSVYTSFFWSNNFFSYIPYKDEYANMEPKEILKLHNKAVMVNMLANPPKTNVTGSAFTALEKTTVNAEVKVVLKSGGGRVSCNKNNGLIAFDMVGSDGYYDVWVMKPDGSGKRNLTHSFKEIPKHNGNPCWDSTGKYIVFQAQDPNFRMKNETLATPGIGINNNIYIITSDGKKIFKMSKVRNGGGSLHPQFSADGKKLIWSNAIPSENPIGNWEMMLFGISLNSQPKLQSMDTLSPGGMQLYETHGFSPDGKTIIFSGVLKNKGYFDMEIYTCTTDGDGLKRLTSNTDWDEHAHYSPDGKKIVWASSVNTGCPKEASKLQLDYWVMNADGSGKRRITFLNDQKNQQYMGKVMASDFDWVDSKRIIAKLGVVENGVKLELILLININT
jgi:hypothetical protein